MDMTLDENESNGAEKEPTLQEQFRTSIVSLVSRSETVKKQYEEDLHVLARRTAEVFIEELITLLNDEDTFIEEQNDSYISVCNLSSTELEDSHSNCFPVDFEIFLPSLAILRIDDSAVRTTLLELMTEEEKQELNDGSTNPFTPIAEIFTESEISVIRDAHLELLSELGISCISKAFARVVRSLGEKRFAFGIILKLTNRID